MIIKESYIDGSMNYHVIVSVNHERSVSLEFHTIVSDEFALNEAKKVIDKENKRES